MFSQRGVINLLHNDASVDAAMRRGNAMRMNGIDAEWLTPTQIKERVPLLDLTGGGRFPVLGGLIQPRGGTARHDAVAWGYARGADARGVDIIQNCEVTGIIREGDTVTGVETTRGRINAGKVGIAVAGHTSHVAAMAGLRLPIESHILQAMVSEPVKPCMDTVITSGSGHMYISQSDKGELVFGGDLEFHNSYAQRGNFPRLEQVTQNILTLFPAFSRLRLMRSWGGIMDMTMDGSPIISKTPISNFYINGGWCYGGFKATPGSGYVFAHTIAQDRPHATNEALSLQRFETGATLDEVGTGPVPKAH